MSADPYRSDELATRERLGAAEAELAEIARTRHELAGLEQRRAELEREIAALRRRLGARALPLLERVRVASPCDASWDDMVGDEQQRFCGQCGKDVFDLSALSRDEAEAFVRERAGACVRLYRRSDGTVLTADCPTGARARRRRGAVLAVAGAGALTASLIAIADRRGAASVEGHAEPVGEPLAMDSRLTLLQGAMVLEDREAPPAAAGPAARSKRTDPRAKRARTSAEKREAGAAAVLAASLCHCVAGDPLCACAPASSSARGAGPGVVSTARRASR